jgi:hypothetical protein
VTSQRATHAFERVDDWLFSEPMKELLGMFDAPADGTIDTWLQRNEELPAWLDPIVQGAAPGGLSAQQTDVLRRTLAAERTAGTVFNFRTKDGAAYRERSQAVTGDFSDDERGRVLALTDALGLVSPRRPRCDRYDHTLVLGGGYRSPLLRTRYTAQLRAAGVALGELSFLGSPRFLIEEPPEHPVTRAYAPEATDEFGLMVGAVRSELGLAVAEPTYVCGCDASRVHCPNWRSRTAATADATPPEFTHERRAAVVDGDGHTLGWVLSASTGRPPLRPDTSDTLDLWARTSDPRPGQRVLLVTTQVFVPFQTFDALRRLYLPFDVEVEAVGYGADWGDRPQTAEYLLQETLSAIRSARRLLVDAAAVLRAAAPRP